MSEPFVGEIIMFAGNFAPQGYAQCSGQILSISQNSTLFALIGTTYGGDGQSTFALPDLRGRVPVHQGQGGGLPVVTVGEVGGAQVVPLLAAQLPSHTHAVHCTNDAGTQEGPTGALWATDASGATAEYDPPTGVALAAGAISNAGSSTPVAHANVQPSLALTFCIALFGVFPSRN